MYGHWHGMGYGMGAGMWIAWILLVVAIVVVVVVLLLRSGTSPPRSPTDVSTSRAREILEERYARGEISTEEYRERATELGRR